MTLNLNNLTEVELRNLRDQVNAELAVRFDQKAQQLKRTLRINDSVKWHGKFGPSSGTVHKVKRKWVEVRNDRDGRIWNVAMSALEIVD